MHVLSGPWPARVTWVLLPVVAGPALQSALDDTSRAVGLTGAALVWVVWTGVLVALLLPRTVSLTALRVGAPLALVAATWSAASGASSGLAALALGWSALVVITTFSPFTGDAFVNGSAYGDERRMALRVPTALLLGPVPLAWLAALVGPVGGPLLLAAGRWLAGGLVLLGGIPLAVAAVRTLHGLARRWVVFVPAGMVLHDPAGLVDPVLFPRGLVARVGPAPAPPDPGALDLTQGALGLVLQVELREPTSVAPRRRGGRSELEVVEVVSLLFSPTLPGAVLAEAAARRLPVS